MDPLAQLADFLFAGKMPPFDWVVEHMPDGTLDAAWAASADTMAMERLVYRSFPRSAYIDGVLAMVAPAVRAMGAENVLAPFFDMTRALARNASPQSPIGEDPYPELLRLLPDTDHPVRAVPVSLLRSVAARIFLRSRGRSGRILWSTSTITDVLNTFWKTYADWGGRPARGNYAKTLREHWPAPTWAQLEASLVR